MKNRTPGASELDKCAHRVAMYAADSLARWNSSGITCHRCGAVLETSYCEERLYMVRCRNCGTVTLTYADSPKAAALQIGVPDKVVDALTRCLYDNVYDHDYWVNARDILGIDMESAKMMADEILRGFYTPAPCDECTGTSCADCELKDVCITWDMEE